MLARHTNLTNRASLALITRFACIALLTCLTRPHTRLAGVAILTSLTSRNVKLAGITDFTGTTLCRIADLAGVTILARCASH